MNNIKKRNIDLNLEESLPYVVDMGLGLLPLKLVRKRLTSLEAIWEGVRVALEGIESLVAKNSSSVSSISLRRGDFGEEHIVRNTFLGRRRRIR